MVARLESNSAWEVIVSTARGSAHESSGAPLQDAAGFGGEMGVSGGVVAAAVADGHGNQRHFRSDSGSRFAITVGVSIARELAPDIASAASEGAEPAEAVKLAVQTTLVDQLVERWRDEVLRDVATHPFDEGSGDNDRIDDVTVPYGTTLVLGFVTGRWLVLCQIGDGDAVVVYEDGEVALPVPGDPRNDGWRTTSLCQVNSRDAFRVAAINHRARPVAAVLLATDGLGNAQVDDPWQPGVGQDLIRLAREHGVGWMRGQIPPWVAKCASSEGSGDDAAAALMLVSTPFVSTLPARELEG